MPRTAEHLDATGQFGCDLVSRSNCVRVNPPGSLDVPSSAMEYDLAKAGMHMLIEKPISMRPTEEIGRLGKVGACLMRRRHHVWGLIFLYSCA